MKAFYDLKIKIANFMRYIKITDVHVYSFKMKITNKDNNKTEVFGYKSGKFNLSYSFRRAKIHYIIRFQKFKFLLEKIIPKI